MKNLTFMDDSSIVLQQTKSSTEIKNRVLDPNFELVKAGFIDKQDSKFPLFEKSLDNLFLVGKIELNIAADVQAIVLAMEPVKQSDGSVKNEIRKAYKVIPEIIQVNNVDTVKHIFKKFSMSKNQRPIIEAAKKAKLTPEMLTV